MRSIHGGFAPTRANGRSTRFRLAAALAVTGMIAGGAIAASSAGAVVALSTSSIDNLSSWDGSTGVSSFGVPDTATYGEVVTAPAGTPTLSNFTFEMDLSPATIFRGEVYAWDGEKAVGSALWEGSPTHTAVATYAPVTFATGGVSLVGGQKYVLFATVSKDYGALDATTGVWGIHNVGAPALDDGFVFSNNGSDFSSLTSNAWARLDGYNLAFRADFNASATNLVQNGSFEDPALAGAVSTLLNGDASSLTDWATGSDSVDVLNGYSGSTAGDGNQYVDLNGAAPGSVSQTLATVAGQFYTLSFEMAANPDTNAVASCIADGDRSLSVDWAGENVGNFTSDPTTQAWNSLGWTTNTIDVTASGTSTPLEFVGTNSGCAGALLDAVSVVPRQVAQTITFGSIDPVTYTPGETVELSGSSDSGLPVSYDVTGPCSVDGSTLTVTGAGDCVITASQAGNNNYLAALPVQQTLTIDQAEQSILFSLPTSLAYYPGLHLTPGASTSSGLPVSFDASGPCSLSYGTLNISGVGTCTVEATQSGDSNYLPAANIFRRITIAPGATSLSLSQYSIYEVLKAARTNSLPLTATLTAAGVPVAGVPVVFSINHMNFCTAITGWDGSATCYATGGRLTQLRHSGIYGAGFAGNSNLLSTAVSRFVH